MINQIDINKLFDSDYIFQTYPPAQGLYLYLVIIFGIFVLGAVAVWWINRKNKNIIYHRLLNSLFNLSLTIGVLGLVFIFFRYEQIPYLGSRFLFLLLLVVFIIWAGFIGWYRLMVMPKEIKTKLQKDKFEKYLPASRAGLPRTRSNISKQRKKGK